MLTHDYDQQQQHQQQQHLPQHDPQLPSYHYQPAFPQPVPAMLAVARSTACSASARPTATLSSSLPNIAVHQRTHHHHHHNHNQHHQQQHSRHNHPSGGGNLPSLLLPSSFSSSSCASSASDTSRADSARVAVAQQASAVVAGEAIASSVSNTPCFCPDCCIRVAANVAVSASAHRHAGDSSVPSVCAGCHAGSVRFGAHDPSPASFSGEVSMAKCNSGASAGHGNASALNLQQQLLQRPRLAPTLSSSSLSSVATATSVSSSSGRSATSDSHGQAFQIRLQQQHPQQLMHAFQQHQHHSMSVAMSAPSASAAPAGCASTTHANPTINPFKRVHPHHPHHQLSKLQVQTLPPMSVMQAVTLATPNSEESGSSLLNVPSSHYDAMKAFEDMVVSRDTEEYGHEIFAHMLAVENATMPPPNIMEGQTDITWKMRKTLILWLGEVHIEYDLRQETLYLAVNIIDRMCAKLLVARHRYQLLGITALWVASKYEENHGKVPSLKNLVFICCNSYTEADIIQMERQILRDLSFEIGAPTQESFLKARCALFLNGCTQPEARAMARYIMEFSMIHRRFVGVKPSLISLASIFLADELLGKPHWYHQDEVLHDCMEQLLDCMREPPKQLIKKFSADKFLNSSATAKIGLDAYNARRAAEASGLLTPPKEVLKFADNAYSSISPMLVNAPHAHQHMSAHSSTAALGLCVPSGNPTLQAYNQTSAQTVQSTMLGERLYANPMPSHSNPPSTNTTSTVALSALSNLAVYSSLPLISSSPTVAPHWEVQSVPLQQQTFGHHQQQQQQQHRRYYDHATASGHLPFRMNKATSQQQQAYPQHNQHSFHMSDVDAAFEPLSSHMWSA